MVRIDIFQSVCSHLFSLGCNLFLANSESIFTHAIHIFAFAFIGIWSIKSHVFVSNKFLECQLKRSARHNINGVNVYCEYVKRMCQNATCEDIRVFPFMINSCLIIGFAPLFQTDVPIPQFQHHWTQPHGSLQRLCRNCFGWPESLALSGRKVGHLWESGQ